MRGREPWTPWASTMQTQASQICWADQASDMQQTSLHHTAQIFKSWFLCVMKNNNYFFDIMA